MSEQLFEAGCEFCMQLPYLNVDGNPIVVDINWHDAEALVRRHKTHRVMKASSKLYVLTPITTAATGVEFQIGGVRY